MSCEGWATRHTDILIPGLKGETWGTQFQLSQRCGPPAVGVVQVVVSNYEVGKLRITAEVALRLAAALDVPIQDLLHTDTRPEIVQQPKPSRKVLERLERIESLPRRKQDAILMTIDHFLNSATG